MSEQIQIHQRTAHNETAEREQLETEETIQSTQDEGVERAAHVRADTELVLARISFVLAAA
jgi:hypothetical protein